MKALSPIFDSSEMKFCSVPVPPINDHKGGVFDFTPIQISNYGQSQTHPSIVYIQGGWNGHEYWLATTPYPKSTGVFENPCIYYGDADINGNPPSIFYPISGNPNGEYSVVNNPIVKVPNTTATNSDPDLFFDGAFLWLISRENSNSFATYSQKSSDGHSWTARGNRDTGYLWKKGVGTLLNKPEFLSPALVKIGSEIFVYCLSGTAGIYSTNERINKGFCWGIHIMKGTTLEGVGDFQFYKKGTFSGKLMIEPWHFDVFEYDSKYYAICSASNKNTGETTNYVYLAESTDGLDFKMYSRPLLKYYPQYRPTAVVVNGNIVIYWCSECGAPTTSTSYPNGAPDVPVDGRAIGVSSMPFNDLLNELKSDEIIGW